MELTAEIVRDLLHYNPETGALTWLPRDRRRFRSERAQKAWNSKNAGKAAGTLKHTPWGYPSYSVSVFKKRFYAHRLAWLYMTGEWPKTDIDHINRDATDNRWENLRESKGGNQRNLSMMRTNTSGVTGVSWNKRIGKWHAYSHFEGKRYHLGFFDEIDEAAMEVLEFRADHGFSRDHGLELAHYHKPG